MEERELVIKRAKNAIISRDFSLALRIYNALLKEEPKNREYLCAVGSIYEKTNSDAMALGYFQKILENSPKDLDALIHTGGIYRRLKMYDEAISVLKKALETGSRKAEVNYNLGFTYKFMGKNDEAIECFESVIDENPSDVLAYNHLGSIYHQKRDYIKSITTYKMGLQIDSNHPIIQYNLAKSYEAIHDEKNAVKSYESALRSKPGWVDAVKDYANLLIRQHKTRNALDLVQKSMELHPERTDLCLMEGKIHFHQCNYPEAENILENLVRKTQNSAEAFALLARVQESQGKYSDAVANVLRAEDVCTEDELFKVTELAVRIHLSAGQIQEAYSKLVLLSDNKSYVTSLDLQGQLAICTEKEEGLDRLRSKILGSRQDYYKFYTNWGHRFLLKKKYSEAKKYFKKHVEMNRKSLMAWLYLGMADEKLSYFESAAEDFKMVLNLDPSNFIARARLSLLTEQMNELETKEKPEEDDSLEDVEPEEPFEPPVKQTEAAEVQEEAEAEDESQSLEEISSGEDADIFSMDDSFTPAAKDKSLAQELLEGEELSDFGYEMPEEEQEEEEQEEEEQEEEEQEEPEKDEKGIYIDVPESENQGAGREKNPENKTASSKNTEDSTSEGGNENPSEENTSSADSETPEPAEGLQAPFEEDAQESPFDFLPEDSTLQGPSGERPEYIPPQNPYENPYRNERGGPARPDNPFYRENPSNQGLSPEAERKLNDTLSEAKKAVEQAREAAQNAADSAATVDNAENLISQMTEDAARKLQNAADDIQAQMEEARAAMEKSAAQRAEAEEKERRKAMADKTEPDVKQDSAENPQTHDTEHDSANDGGHDESHGAPHDGEHENYDDIPFAESVDSDGLNSVSGAQGSGVLQANSAKSDFDETDVANREAFEQYQKLVNQVSQVLPLVENMLVNKEDSKKFQKEIDLFYQLKELGDFLPPEQKQEFLTSRMRVLLDFLIAKLSGRPGLLKTTDSLRRSGVFEKLDETLLEKVSPEYENYSERQLMKKVISDMRRMTSSLNDRNLATGLDRLAKEAEQKL